VGWVGVEGGLGATPKRGRPKGSSGAWKRSAAELLTDGLSPSVPGRRQAAGAATEPAAPVH